MAFNQQAAFERIRNLKVIQEGSAVMTTKALATPVMVPPPQGAVPIQQVQPPPLLGSRNDALEERIKRYRDRPLRLIDCSKFDHLPDITTGMRPVKDFNDSTFLKEPSLVFERLPDDDIAELGRSILPLLASGFSQKDVGGLFLLAYHLKRPNNDEFVFEAPVECITDHDKEYGELSTRRMAIRGKVLPLTASLNASEEAKAYSFVTASTLRLFTKSESDYIKAFNHIIGGYQKFYGYELPVLIPTPTEDGLKSLTHHFSTNPIFRFTLYKMLYMVGSSENQWNMRNFLFEIHLAHTGMHILGIFVRLCQALNCKPTILLATIAVKEYERQVDSLVEMIMLAAKDDDEHKRSMWRFGRLFDRDSMTPLRTKSCPALTYILACALKNESAASNQGILDIYFSVQRAE